MATVSLTIMYCLNLTLSNGTVKHFELHNPTSIRKTDFYFTPARCTSENEFWIKGGKEILFDEIFNSPLDFGHWKYLINETNEWYAKNFRSNSAVSTTINGVELPTTKHVGLNEGDKLQIKYDAMSEPLNLVYGKCSEMIQTVPVKIATINTTESPKNQLNQTVLTTRKFNRTESATQTLNQTESTTQTLNQTESTTQTLNPTESTIKTAKHPTTLQFNLAESTSFDPSNKNLMGERRDIGNLEEFVKVLNEEMETLKPKIALQDQRTGNTSGLPRLTVFTVLSVLAISIVLAFNIYQSKMQSNRIKILSLDVYRYQSKI